MADVAHRYSMGNRDLVLVLDDDPTRCRGLNARYATRCRRRNVTHESGLCGTHRDQTWLLGDQEATDSTTGDIVTEAIDRAGELRRAVEAHPPGPGTYDSKVVLALLDVVDAAAPLVSHVGESQDGEWDAAEERLADALARFGRLYS